MCKERGGTIAYISTDGAITWSDEGSPSFYMQMTEEKLTDSVASIPIKIVNDSDNNLITGIDFSLYVWDGKEWVSTGADELFHTQEAYFIESYTSYEMACYLQNIRLKAGKYFITKTVSCENNKSRWILSTEFIVE